MNGPFSQKLRKNVPVAAIVERLANLDRPIRVEIYPGLEHGLVDPNTENATSKYLDDLIEFIESSGG